MGVDHDIQNVLDKATAKARGDFNARPDKDILVSVNRLIEEIQTLLPWDVDNDGPRPTLVNFDSNPYPPLVVPNTVEDYYKNTLKYDVTFDTVGLTQQQIDDGFIRITIISWTL